LQANAGALRIYYREEMTDWSRHILMADINSAPALHLRKLITILSRKKLQLLKYSKNLSSFPLGIGTFKPHPIATSVLISVVNV